MIAGVSIDFLPGSTIISGGYLHGYIAPVGPYCVSPPMAPVTTAGLDVVESGPDPSYFSIYPNPTNGLFTVEQKSLSISDPVNIEIYGMQGGKIISEMFNGQLKHQFSLSDHPAGIYIIRMISGNHTETRKIIKQ